MVSVRNWWKRHTQKWGVWFPDLDPGLADVVWFRKEREANELCNWCRSVTPGDKVHVIKVWHR